MVVTPLRHVKRILLVAKCSDESIEPTILSNILLRQPFSEKTDFGRGKLLARIQRGHLCNYLASAISVLPVAISEVAGVNLLVFLKRAATVIHVRQLALILGCIPSRCLFAVDVQARTVQSETHGYILNCFVEHQRPCAMHSPTH